MTKLIFTYTLPEVMKDLDDLDERDAELYSESLREIAETIDQHILDNLKIDYGELSAEDLKYPDNNEINIKNRNN